MRFKRVVAGVEVAALIAVLLFLVALSFDRWPWGEASEAPPASVGAQLFATNCASCHGADATGGLGPKLAGRVKKLFPDAQDQIAFVKQGKGTMPSFEGDLTDAQIEAIVEYTRSLGG